MFLFSLEKAFFFSKMYNFFFRLLANSPKNLVWQVRYYYFFNANISIVKSNIKYECKDYAKNISGILNFKYVSK